MNKSRKIYTYALPIIIILNGYASGISGLSMGAIIMNIFNLYALLLVIANRKKVDVFLGRTVGLLTLFFFLSCIGYLAYGMISPTSIITSVLKILTWFLGVTFTASCLFDYSIFKAYYKKFCVVCTIYLFLQMLSWNIMHVYLPNLFDFGPLHPLYEQYSSAAYVNYLSAIGFGRFSSFFAEPAYYGIMIVVGLVIMLFDEEPERTGNGVSPWVLLLMLGVWLSTSTASIVFVIFILAVYYFKTNITNKLLLFFIGISVAFLSLNIFTNTTLGGFFIDKMTTMGTSGRVGQSYSELSRLSWPQRLFGVGLGNINIVTESKYVNEFTGLMMEYGLTGFIAFLIYMVKLYKREKSTALHVLIVIYLAAMAQGGYLFNLYGILLFSIALSFKKFGTYVNGKEYVE